MNKNDATQKIKELRERLGALTNKEVYDCIWRLSCELEDAGVDCESVLDDIITEEEAEKTAKYRLEEYGLQSLRCYLGDAYSDEIYRLNGYANLANIYDDDWEDILDEILWRVNNSDLVEEERQ